MYVKVIFEFDSRREGDSEPNMVTVYDDGTYVAQGLPENGRSNYRIEDGRLFYKHPSMTVWAESENDTFKMPFMDLIAKHIEDTLIGDTNDDT